MNLLATASDEELVEASELYPSLWVQQHNIKNERGLPIEFEKRKFLVDIYNDMSPLQVVLKPPQVGMTVCFTLKSLYVAKKLKKQIIYTLPTQGDIQDMVGGSINRIIYQNPILMAWVKDHDTIEQKSVGDSIIFYRGTFTSKQAMMVPSGLNIHDEVDASDPDVITQYETRLQAEEGGGMRWYYSHPSLAGHGVDLYYAKSDKKEWHVVCPYCEEEQILTWPDNISLEKSIYVCRSCKGELPDSARIQGRWKATAEGTFSGYHISQLMLYNKSAKDIIESYNDPMKDKQYFFNYVLGLPYQASDDKIEPKVVLRNCVDEVNAQEGRIIIGVDTGLPIHYTLLNKDGIFYYGTCSDPTTGKDPYDDLEVFLKRWPRSVMVCDQGGDLIGIRKLQARYPGRIFLCFYRKDRKTNETTTWGTDDDYGNVTVDRNRMIQLIVEQMRETGRFRLNGTKDEWADWAAHFGNIYREKVVVKDLKDKDNRSLYGTEYVWKRSGPDHFVHTLVYAMVGSDRYSQNLATIVQPDVFEGLPGGRMISDSGVQLTGQRVDL
jgi:hypothetical protein